MEYRRYKYYGGAWAFFVGITSSIAVDGKVQEVLGVQGAKAMFIQICMDYSSLPPLHDMTYDEIEFFYKPLIDGLIETQKMSKKG